MDTPYPWELNIWYHALNVGFRTRISGETDFPCITDARVGQGRVYAKVDGPLSYRGWVEAEWGESENNRRAKFYSLTKKGRKQLEQEIAEWERLTAAIALVLKEV